VPAYAWGNPARVQGSVSREVNYVFCIQVENRDGLDLYLKENEIGTSIYYSIPCIYRSVLPILGIKQVIFPWWKSYVKPFLRCPCFLN
jgi:hypothetical protein